MEFIKLGDIVTVKKGKKPSFSVSPTESSVRFLQIDDLRNDKNLKFTDDKTGVFVDEDDVLLAWDGANAGTVGFGKVGYIGSTIAVLKKKNPEKFSTVFIGKFLQSQFKYLRSKATGATIPHIDRKSLDTLKLPIIDFSDQIRIAEILTQVENLIQKRKESIELLDELLKSTFLEMFGDPVRNEKGWEKMNISQIGKDEKRAIKSGPFGSQLLISELLVDGIPVYGIDNVQKNKFIDAKPKFISENKYNDLIAFKIESEDILITRTGTVGRTCLAPKDIDKCIIGPNLLKITLNQDIALPIFISSAFNFCNSIIDKIKELSPGATVAVFNTTNLKSLKLGIPPVELQKKFSRIFDNLEILKKDYEASLNELENMYGVLSQKAFKGELNIK